jgi:hypothetical protein
MILSALAGTLGSSRATWRSSSKSKIKIKSKSKSKMKISKTAAWPWWYPASY